MVNSSISCPFSSHVCLGNYDGSITAFDKDTGAKTWTFVTNGHVDSSPAIDALGTIYVGSYDGNLYALNKKSSTPVWKLNTGKTFIIASPAIAEDGSVVIGTADGFVYMISAKGGATCPQ